MSKKFDIDINKTDVPTAAYRVLLNFAFQVVCRDVPILRQRQPYHIAIGRCERNLFMGRFTGGRTFSLGFKEPSNCKSFVSRLGDTPFSTFNEMVVGIAAWMFAQDMLGDSRRTRAISRDAILAAQEQAQALDERVATAKAQEESKAGQAFARVVLRNMEHNSLEFRLKLLDGQEKVWQRKLKLATTKLQGLKRRRSALIAADKRKRAKITV